MDTRETDLARLLPTAVIKQLVLGDIVLETDDGAEFAIIERKTVADLAASIKDGRYREQSARLKACSLANHNILYLIEGTLRGAKLPMPCETLMATMVSLLFGKGFSVVRTESVEPTAQFVEVMCKKLDKEDAYRTEKQVEPVYEAKVHKMDKITPDNIQSLMLSQIPYVSMATAEAVLSQFETVPRLTAALQKDPDCLADVKFLGNKRRISSKSVESIQKFLKVFSPTAPYGGASETREDHAER